jgi:hypothetical protein
MGKQAHSMPDTQQNRPLLKDEPVSIKLKLAALWTAVTLCYLYGDYFELYVPGKLEGMQAGTSMLNTPIFLLIAAAFLAIPAMMVFLSVLLKPKWNRVLNMVFGIVFTLIVVSVGFSASDQWYLFYKLYAVIEIIITLIIIRTAYLWPKQ